MKFEILKRETVYKGRAFEVQNLEVRMPNDRLTHYDLVKHSGAVTLIPLDRQGNILFVRQFRIAVNSEMLELPAGTLEPGEEPEVCAAREIREETGMAARGLRKLGDYFLAPGYSSEHMHVYLATDLYEAPLKADDDEFLQVQKIPITKAFEMAAAGEIKDAKTLASLLMAQPYLLGKL
jgi:ADP-ribose pyrophosphatase